MALYLPRCPTGAAWTCRPPRRIGTRDSQLFHRRTALVCDDHESGLWGLTRIPVQLLAIGCETVALGRLQTWRSLRSRSSYPRPRKWHPPENPLRDGARGNGANLLRALLDGEISGACYFLANAA